MAQHFVAFASNDRTHAETITAAAKEASFGEVEYVPWTGKDASGAPLGRSVDSWVDAAEGVIADITFVNDNVTYEIGYAIGAGKSLRLIRNETISSDDLKAIGLLNTVLRDPFKTRPNLVALLQSKPAPRSSWHKQQKNKDQPLFILSPPMPTPFSTGLISAVKKSMRIKFRSFNPRELIKLRELINKLTSTGVRKEFISAFWQYVLWLEIAYKILEKDAKPARRDSTLLERYERLEAAFRSRVDTGTGDFSERLRLLTDRIEARFAQHESAAASGTLMSSQILQIVYGSDIATIRNEILCYLKLKGIVLFLFDNLDRMRAPGGFDDMDSILILGLVERQIIGEPALAASSTFSLEPVDKIDRGEEATARSGADTTSCDRDRQMRRLQSDLTERSNDRASAAATGSGIRSAVFSV